MSDAHEDQRERVINLLTERGVHAVGDLVDELPDEALDGALAVIARFDQQGGDSPGLLVYRLRHDAEKLAGYKLPGHRSTVSDVPASDGAPKPLTPRLLQTVRGSCNSPDGCDRDAARGMFAAAAGARGLSADELIDRAMGADWEETPISNPLLREDLDPHERRTGYDHWVATGELPLPPLKRL